MGPGQLLPDLMFESSAQEKAERDADNRPDEGSYGGRLASARSRFWGSAQENGRGTQFWRVRSGGCARILN